MIERIINFLFPPPEVGAWGYTMNSLKLTALMLGITFLLCGLIMLIGSIF